MQILTTFLNEVLFNSKKGGEIKKYIYMCIRLDFSRLFLYIKNKKIKKKTC